MYSKYTNQNFYCDAGLNQTQQESKEHMFHSQQKQIILEVKAKSETVHYAKPSAHKTNSEKNTQRRASKTALIEICKNANSGRAMHEEGKPANLSAIKKALTSGKNKKGGKASQTNGLKKSPSPSRRQQGAKSNVSSILGQNNQNSLQASFSRSYLEYIGVKQAKWHNTKVAKRGKNFMLSIYRSSSSKNIDEIRTKLLFGAFGMKKGIKIRFAL